MRIRDDGAQEITNGCWLFKGHDGCGTIGIRWVDRGGIVDDIAILFMVGGEEIALHNEMRDIVCFTRGDISRI